MQEAHLDKAVKMLALFGPPVMLIRIAGQRRSEQKHGTTVTCACAMLCEVGAEEMAIAR